MIRTDVGNPPDALRKDSKVNIQDVQACLNHILYTQDWETRADVEEIVNIILKNDIQFSIVLT